MDSPSNEVIPLAVVEPIAVRALHLHRLYPEQLTEHWAELLLPAVQVGLGSAPTDANIELAYYALKHKTLIPYVLVAEVEGIDKPAAVGALIMGISKDSITATKTLHIWSLWGNAHMQLGDWAKGLAALGTICREFDCTSVTAQTTNQRVVELVESLGGKVEAKLLRLEV